MESESVRNKVLVLGRAVEEKIELVKELYKLSEQSIPEELSKDELEAISIPFKIDNKYYSATIDFWIDLSEEAPDEDVALSFDAVGSAIDAIVFVYSQNKPDHFRDLHLWSSFISKWEPAITICVETPSENKTDETVDSTEAEDWCIDNGFEYINLNLENQETDSVKRVFEALQSHNWEGLELKGKSSGEEFSDSDILPEDKTNPSQSDVSNMHDAIFGTTLGSTNHDPISVIQGLRDQAQSLPDEERRNLAAKVALAFSLELDASEPEPSDFA